MTIGQRKAEAMRHLEKTLGHAETTRIGTRPIGTESESGTVTMRDEGTTTIGTETTEGETEARTETTATETITTEAGTTIILIGTLTEEAPTGSRADHENGAT